MLIPNDYKKRYISGLSCTPLYEFLMISAKHHKLVFSFFMSLLMSCIMSFVISVFNVGLVSNIIAIWLQAWSFAFIVAFPTIIIVSPVVHKLVALVLREESHSQ
ncbi:DUF2798 domain-containing protein [Rheinheimera sp. WS51]|uniref:DUF2798 domain-containing protein n=1 Tax=Rheinheimera sp. WS51 TaxID=3425886 RepID=UPI003D91794C